MFLGELVMIKNMFIASLTSLSLFMLFVYVLFGKKARIIRSANKLVKSLDDLLFITDIQKTDYHNNAQRILTKISTLTKHSKKIDAFIKFDKHFDDYCKEKQKKFKILKGLLEEDYLRISDMERVKEIIEQNFTRKKGYLVIIQRYLNEYLKQTIEGELKTLQGCIKFLNDRYKMKEKEIHQDIFNLEGYTLDNDQQEAVVTDEQSCLVIAGAGCGKTSMLISKVAYLLKKGVNPERILLLSFTKKTVSDLEKRLKKINPKLKVYTFHKLGKDITGKEYDETITVANTIREILSSQDSKFVQLRKEILDYIAYYAQYFDLEQEYSQNQMSIADYEELKYSTLRDKIQILTGKKETLRGEKVKSPAEIEIANFLFLQGVDYTYEKEYPYPFHLASSMHGITAKNKKYRPDFCIKTPKGEIWLEHFGIKIDAEGNYHAHWCSEEQKYIQHIYDKRYTHDCNKTVLLETNETMHERGELLYKLAEMLQKNGIKFTPITDETISQYLSKLINDYRFQSFSEYVSRFIEVYKSQKKFSSLKALKELIQKSDPLIQNKSLLNKTNKFFDVITEIYTQYQQQLEDEDSVDFNDMITVAIKNIENGVFKCPFDYVIVDEFQDITQKRVDFLKAIQNQTNAKLFCVGDDWQSIYGFSGSDVSLFTEFNFLYAGQPLFIQNTHRNSQELVDIAGNFIMANPSQLKKQLNAGNIHCSLPIQYTLYGYRRTDGCKKRIDALLYTLDYIVNEHKTSKLDICLLGRYNLDVYNYNDGQFIPRRKQGVNCLLYQKNAMNGIINLVYEKYPDIKSHFTTIHKSKGAEYDYTILIDLEESPDRLSFPSQIKDDEMIAPMLFHSDFYPCAEERRIFYVALTRCKKQCYLLVSEYMPSRFFKEIQDEIKPINETSKQYCERTGNTLCPMCREGILVWRENKKDGSKFLGCSRYPKCRYTQQYLRKK